MSWVTVKEPLEMCLEAIQSRADDSKWKGNRVVEQFDCRTNTHASETCQHLMILIVMTTAAKTLETIPAIYFCWARARDFQRLKYSSINNFLHLNESIKSHEPKLFPNANLFAIKNASRQRLPLSRVWRVEENLRFTFFCAAPDYSISNSNEEAKYDTCHQSWSEWEKISRIFSAFGKVTRIQGRSKQQIN